MKRERGFSLIELLVATAVAGVVLNAIGAAVHQLVTATESGSDTVTAVHELETVAHWVSIDGQRAVTATGGSGLVLTLPDSSSVSYSLEGSELHRTADGSRMTLAQHISDISFSVENRTITMTITASPPGRQEVSKQGTYKVYLRPTGE